MEPIVLHIGNSKYPSLREAGHTLRIWTELARGARQYHVLARSESLRFGHERVGNVELHLVPGVRSGLFPALAYRAMGLARRYKPDVVLCQDPVLGGAAAVHVGRLFNVPVLMEIHTDVHFHNLESRRPDEVVLGRLARYALRRSTAVRIVSPRFADPLLRAGVRSSALIHIPYRVDLTRFVRDEESRRRGREGLELTDDAFVVTSVGRFVEQKGYAELISAWGDVVREYPQARLVLLGGGPLEETYRRTAQRAGAQHAVRLLSWRPQEKLVDVLSASDLYVQPSVPGKGEAMPRTILEAMATRLPVVATRVAGIPDVVEDRRNGLLVEAGDQAALSRAILSLAMDPHLRERLAARGCEDARTLYEWSANFSRFRETLRALAAGHTPGQAD
jgi:glycosyltransferase involved in cell wall biosynthesis